MELTPENIETIKLYTDKIEKWAENLSYSVRPPGNLWMNLALALRPQSVQGFANWLVGNSRKGQKVADALNELSMLIQEVDAWRNQGVYAEELGDFCVRINRLIRVTRNIISMLRSMTGTKEPERLEPKIETVEESKAPKKQELPTAVTPSQRALMAYKLHFEMGLTIEQIANKMTEDLKLDEVLRPWQISRWIKQVENQRKRSHIPIRSIHPGASETKTRSTKT